MVARNSVDENRDVLPGDIAATSVSHLPASSPSHETSIPPPISNRELHGQVWRLAWPSVLTMLLQTFNSLMDMLFVGHLPNGPMALAATGVGGNILFLLISLAMGVTVGTTALVARFTGAKTHEDAVHVTGQSITLCTILGLVFGLLGYASRGLLVSVMLDSNRSPEAAALCSQFLGAALLATVPMFLMSTLYAAFRGLGDTRTPLLITVLMIATHVTFNGLLIYGKLGFPQMGVQGAGAALSISNCLGALLFSIALIRLSSLRDAWKREHLRLELDWARRILKIGIPASIQALVRTLSMMAFIGLIARAAESAAGVAALQIGMRAEAIAFMPGFGYSVAAAALVGQSLGAKDTRRAERCGWAATYQAIGVMSGMAVIFFVLAQTFTHFFTSDPLVQALGTDYLRINAFAEPFLALGMVLTGALQGAGDTVRPTYITFLTMWIIRMPMAYILMFTLKLHTHGAWLSMMLTTIAGGLLTVFLFRSGKWKRIKV